MGHVADLPQGKWGSSAGADVPQGLGKQGSDKQRRLTAQGIRRLENALKIANGGDQPSNSWVADTYGIDRGTVADLISRQKAVTRSSIEKLFDPLNLDLLAEDYEFWPVSKKPKTSQPNPFEQAGLWGCDALLRRIFERLEKGGSQALIGPAGCGKSEILRAIVERGALDLSRPVLSLDMHLVRDEQSFFDRLCDCLEIDPLDAVNRVPRQIERELKRRKQAHVLCLDEIHVLTDEAFFPLATRNWLKGMADAEYPLQLVVASQRDLRELFPDSPVRSSPLADFFDSQTERLAWWDLSMVRRFVVERLGESGVTFTVEQIEAIYELSDGMPRKVRELSIALYHEEVR
jgi:hypothetical protein